MKTISPSGAYLCEHEACNCSVADPDSQFKTDNGIFCCKACAEGGGCSHAHCNCAAASADL